MTSKTSKAPPSGAGGALGNAYHGQAISTRDIPLPLQNYQSAFIARRLGVRASHANILVGLVFGEVAR